MALTNTSTITKAVESILKQKAAGYTITRNERKNEDPSACLPKGWVGIYHDTDDYEAYTIGGTPWKLRPSVIINIQVVETTSGAKCEDKLMAAIKDITDPLEADRTLNSTIAYILGYSITYEYNDALDIYHYGANIKLICETQS